MAVHYWDGSTDGDWATAANWTAALPVADGEVIFDGRQVAVIPVTGMTDGGSVSDSGHANAATLDLLHFKSTYTGGIASAALPCITSPDKLVIEGSGTYHISCGKTSQVTDTSIPITIINNKDAIVYLYSNSNSATNLSEFTDVYLLAGTLYIAWNTVELDVGCYVKNLYIAPTNNSPGNTTVDIDKDCFDELNDVPTNIFMQNGTVTCDTQLGTVNMYAGTFTYGDSASAETVLDITRLNLHSGIFTWQPNEAAATITTAYLFGGTLDGSGTTNAGNGKVITTCYLFSGATLDMANNRGDITLTNLYRIGGDLTIDKNAKVAVTYNQP
ncbi:hypothetical protein LCGC14_1024170 [marine sediment metagenome]|uniref:G8 domain-containing protein n=1 Tax=marine sediment metagenome TaxID=412755 RepID=A0A0F9MWJ8_9ZZZZ